MQILFHLRERKERRKEKKREEKRRVVSERFTKNVGVVLKPSPQED